MKINKELADTIVRLRYGCEKDNSINLKNVRKHFHHRQMTRTTEEIVDSLRILYKDADFYQKLTGRQIQNFLKERLSLFRSLDFWSFDRVSRSSHVAHPAADYPNAFQPPKRGDSSSTPP